MSGERFDQTLTTHLMKVVNSTADDWDQHIDEILLGYRVNVQESTKHSPFELLYGVKAKLPIDLEKEDVDVTDDSCTIQDTRVKDLLEAIPQLQDTAKENIAPAQSVQKLRYDLRHAAPTYQVGDSVLKYNRQRETRVGDKLQPRFAGPYEIVEVLGRRVYRLKDGDKELK